jgi:hypothetical protein
MKFSCGSLDRALWHRPVLAAAEHHVPFARGHDGQRRPGSASAVNGILAPAMSFVSPGDMMVIVG